jgi:hypothetical protein
MTGSWRGSDRAAPETGAVKLGRSAAAEDALYILLTAGVLLGLPVLTWVLGIY